MLLAILTIVGTVLAIANGHGRLLEPPSRSSMWRMGFKTPKNYNDNELFCGGFTRQQRNGMKCGVCGDPWDMPSPRPNEAGGRYATGTISRNYIAGQKMSAVVQLTANHRGFFEFRLCPVNNPRVEATDECMAQHPIEVLGEGRVDGYPYRYYVPNPRTASFQATLKLPANLTCSQCVFQWTYTAGNNWGRCEDGTSKVGCGPQETFRGCSDIAITDGQNPVDGNEVNSGDNNENDLNTDSSGGESSKPKWGYGNPDRTPPSPGGFHTKYRPSHGHQPSEPYPPTHGVPAHPHHPPNTFTIHHDQPNFLTNYKPVNRHHLNPAGTPFHHAPPAHPQHNHTHPSNANGSPSFHSRPSYHNPVPPRDDGWKYTVNNAWPNEVNAGHPAVKPGGSTWYYHQWPAAPSPRPTVNPFYTGPGVPGVQHGINPNPRPHPYPNLPEKEETPDIKSPPRHNGKPVTTHRTNGNRKWNPEMEVDEPVTMIPESEVTRLPHEGPFGPTRSPQPSEDHPRVPDLKAPSTKGPGRHIYTNTYQPVTRSWKSQTREPTATQKPEVTIEVINNEILPKPEPPTVHNEVGAPESGTCKGAGLYKGVPGMDVWCTTNCHHVPAFCPPSHCICH